MIDRIGTHEITAPKLASVSDFGQNDFEASVKAASDKRSPHSSAASRKNGTQTGKPHDGGKPTGDELARKTIEALEEAMRGNFEPAMKLLKQLEGKELSEFSRLLKGIEGLGKKAEDFVTHEAKEFGVPVGVAAVAGGIAAVTVDTLGVGGALAAVF
jgi:hypothetical protein